MGLLTVPGIETEENYAKPKAYPTLIIPHGLHPEPAALSLVLAVIATLGLTVVNTNSPCPALGRVIALGHSPQ